MKVTTSDEFYEELKKLIPDLPKEATALKIILKHDQPVMLEVEQYINGEILEAKHKIYRLTEE